MMTDRVLRKTTAKMFSGLSSASTNRAIQRLAEPGLGSPSHVTWRVATVVTSTWRSHHREDCGLG